MKKTRPRLRDGDTVKVVRVPVSSGGYLRRVGKIKGVRGSDKMWVVVFSKKALDWNNFFRHELKLIKRK